LLGGAVKPAALIYNPRAGRWAAANRVARLGRILRHGGWDAKPRATTRSGHATVLARRAADDGAEAIFVYGGDGTLREAAGGLLGRDTLLGFLPGGTANVMQRELGLPPRAEAAAHAMASATPWSWDVGLCAGEPFLMQASAGLDAVILAGLRSRSKRLLGPAAAVWPGFRGWLGYDYPRIDLLADGEHQTCSLVVVGNISRYGGPWRILPAARTDDRRLDLLVFRGRGRLASLGFARDLFLLRGRHLQRDDVSARRVERVELLGPPNLMVLVDGDAQPLRPPLEIRLAAARLRLLGSPRPAGR
jgi:diacylglycerol kinase family enzyme